MFIVVVAVVVVVVISTFILVDCWLLVVDVFAVVIVA